MPRGVPKSGKSGRGTGKKAGKRKVSRSRSRSPLGAGATGLLSGQSPTKVAKGANPATLTAFAVSKRPNTRANPREGGAEMLGEPSCSNNNATMAGRNVNAARKVNAMTQNPQLPVNQAHPQGDGVNVTVQGIDESDNIDDDNAHESECESLADTEEYQPNQVQLGQERPPGGSTSDSEVGFGGTAMTAALKNDPAFMTMVNELVQAGVEAKMSQAGTSVATTPKAGKPRRGNLVKSPSDTTLYRPALAQDVQVNFDRPVIQPVVAPGNTQDMIDRINDFVGAMRVQAPPTEEENGRNAQQAGQREEILDPNFVAEESRANQHVLDAERFKATLAAPPGTSQPMGQGLTDDDFFHLSCHIDSNVRGKIERGEFVDLEKLLPKSKGASFGAEEAGRMEWIHKDGQTYLAPAADMGSKINGIRKWDQAFRIYATVYSGANPTRSQEIWQYVSVIHTAAGSYAWDNVASYDFTFRHLMAFNPQRSWAKIYTQMWNLSMKEPVTRNPNFKQNSVQTGFNNNQKFPSAGGSGRPKTKHCWSFNKGIKCRFGAKCKYIEKCSYCESANHGVVVCPKLVGRGDTAKGGDGAAAGAEKFAASSAK